MGLMLPSMSVSLASTLMFSHAANTTACVSSTATGGCFGGSVVVVVVGGGGGGGGGGLGFVVVVVLELSGPEWPGPEPPPLFFGFGVPAAPVPPDEVAGAMVGAPGF